MSVQARWMGRLCLLVVAAGLWACGGANETSVLLVVKNGSDVVRPEEIQIEVEAGGMTQTLERTAAAGGDARLGDLVIFPASGTASLRISASGKVGDAEVSWGQVDVALKAGAQVAAEVVLMARPPGGDGGLLSPGMDAGIVPSDAGGTDDGGRPDAPGSGTKTTGQACAQGNECVSGSCLDEVCCDKSCAGTCHTCKAAGQPLGQCLPVADGSKCGEPRCGAARRSLIQYMCMAGECQDTQQICSCNKDTLMCE